MNFLNLLDVVILSVLLASCFEVVRLLNPLDAPFKAIGFVLVTVGSFGWINHDIAWANHSVPWYVLVMHTGFAVCSAVLLHTQRARRRSGDHIISKKTLRYLAQHRPTAPSPRPRQR